MTSHYLTIPPRTESEAREAMAQWCDEEANRLEKGGSFALAKQRRERAIRLRNVNLINQLAGVS